MLQKKKVIKKTVKKWMFIFSVLAVGNVYGMESKEVCPELSKDIWMLIFKWLEMPLIQAPSKQVVQVISAGNDFTVRYTNGTLVNYSLDRKGSFAKKKVHYFDGSHGEILKILRSFHDKIFQYRGIDSITRNRIISPSFDVYSMDSYTVRTLQRLKFNSKIFDLSYENDLLRIYSKKADSAARNLLKALFPKKPISNQIADS